MFQGEWDERQRRSKNKVSFSRRMSPKMTEFDFVPSSAEDGIPRETAQTYGFSAEEGGPPKGPFFWESVGSVYLHLSDVLALPVLLGSHRESTPAR